MFIECVAGGYGNFNRQKWTAILKFHVPVESGRRKKTSMPNIWLAKSSMGNELEFSPLPPKKSFDMSQVYITFWWIWDFFPCLHEPLSSFISIVISLSVRACLCVSVNNLSLNLMITGPPLCQWNTSHAPCCTTRDNQNQIQTYTSARSASLEPFMYCNQFFPPFYW